MRTKLPGLGLCVGAVMVLASATGVLAAGPGARSSAPDSMGGSVFNGRGANAVAQVVWGRSDPIAGVDHFGGVFGDIEDSGTLVGLWEKDDHVVTCDAGTPGDPSDDFQATQGTGRTGDGEGTVAIASDLRSAVVTGVITITTYAFDGCAGTWDVTATETGVPLRFELVATGQPSVDSSSSRELVPGVYNTHQLTIGVSRTATGTAALGGRPLAFDAGLISRNRWSYHESSR
jgi:hypothetical protein